MKHEPGGPGGWEPPWMGDMRKIEASVREQVDRYIAASKRHRKTWFFAGMGGYWVGYGTVVALQWLLGLPRI